MDDPFSPERKTVRLNKQNLFGSGYAGLGSRVILKACRRTHRLDEEMYCDALQELLQFRPDDRRLGWVSHP
jgi:hypothetical protein